MASRCRRARRASRRRRSVSIASATRAALADAGEPGGERGGVAEDRRAAPGRSAAAATGSRAAGGAPGPAAPRRPGAITGAVDAELGGDPAGEGAELHLAEEGEQRVGVGVAHLQRRRAGPRAARRGCSVTRSREMRIWSAWPSSTSRRFGCLISPARARRVSRSPYSAMSCGGGLDADAGGAGDVVDRVAGQRLHVDDPVGADAELLDHLVGADRLVLQRVEHLDAGRDELHQVLVGGDDGDPAAGGGRLRGVGGDDVVGLEAGHARCRAG